MSGNELCSKTIAYRSVRIDVRLFPCLRSPSTVESRVIFTAAVFLKVAGKRVRPFTESGSATRPPIVSGEPILIVGNNRDFGCTRSCFGITKIPNTKSVRPRSPFRTLDRCAGRQWEPDSGCVALTNWRRWSAASGRSRGRDQMHSVNGAGPVRLWGTR